jgi:hypothetical protein
MTTDGPAISVEIKVRMRADETKPAMNLQRPRSITRKAKGKTS